MKARRQAKPTCGTGFLNLHTTKTEVVCALLKVGVDVCFPTVCDMHVCKHGGTDAQGVCREVHVCSGKSDVEEACRFLRRGNVVAQDVDECIGSCDSTGSG